MKKQRILVGRSQISISDKKNYRHEINTEILLQSRQKTGNLKDQMVRRLGVKMTIGQETGRTENKKTRKSQEN